MEGIDREGERGEKKGQIWVSLKMKKWSFKFKVSFYIPPYSRKQLIFESSMFKMPAKILNNHKTKKGIKANQTSFLIAERS